MSPEVMTVDRSAEPAPPRTLADAHHALARIRPRSDAPPQQWLAYHQRSAALYAEIAEIDRGHHHEALFYAERERASAQKLKDQADTLTLEVQNCGEYGDPETTEDADAGS